MAKLKLFTGAFLITTCVLMALIYVNRPKQLNPTALELVRITDDVFLTSQIKPENIPALKQRGIRMVVDIQPDGEAKDQTPSAEIESASRKSGITFRYIPVSHEVIPKGAVIALNDALYRGALPAVLYCRTGRRAARLFALVEASRLGGPGADAILRMVREAGFSAEELRNEIAQRISQRIKTGEGRN